MTRDRNGEAENEAEIAWLEWLYSIQAPANAKDAFIAGYVAGVQNFNKESKS